MVLVALRPGWGQTRGNGGEFERPTGYVARSEGIGAGGTLGGGGGGSELLSLDDDFVDEALVDHGSEAGRAEEEHRYDGWKAHFGGRIGRNASTFWSLRAWQEGSRSV
jgi:hypothetical protein